MKHKLDLNILIYVAHLAWLNHQPIYIDIQEGNVYMRYRVYVCQICEMKTFLSIYFAANADVGAALLFRVGRVLILSKRA